MRAILLVDDEIDALDAFGLLLSLHDFSVVTALNGAEAIEKAQRAPPDIVVTDWMMPRMDGVQLCRRLRQNELFAHIPIVMVSAGMGRAIEPDLGERLYDRFLSKPVLFDSLLSTIQELLAEPAEPLGG